MRNTTLNRPSILMGTVMDMYVVKRIKKNRQSVLLMRMLLGLSGNAAITSALSSNASRFSWASVRDYAVLHCRLPVAP